MAPGARVLGRNHTISHGIQGYSIYCTARNRNLIQFPLMMLDFVQNSFPLR